MDKSNSETHAQTFRPQARKLKEEIILERVLEELVVYDLKRGKCHSLNETATKIWTHCDGKHTVADIARDLRIGSALEQDQANKVAWLGINQLIKVGLLQGKPSRNEAHPRSLSRRNLLRALGGLIVLPVVASIVAPTPAQAFTVVGPCFPFYPGCSNACSEPDAVYACLNAGGGAGCNKYPCNDPQQPVCVC